MPTSSFTSSAPSTSTLVGRFSMRDSVLEEDTITSSSVCASALSISTVIGAFFKGKINFSVFVVKLIIENVTENSPGGVSVKKTFPVVSELAPLFVFSIKTETPLSGCLVAASTIINDWACSTDCVLRRKAKATIIDFIDYNLECISKWFSIKKTDYRSYTEFYLYVKYALCNSVNLYTPNWPIIISQRFCELNKSSVFR